MTEKSHCRRSYYCFKSGLPVLTSWFLGLKFLPVLVIEKALVALSKDPGSVPSGHSQPPVTLISGDLMLSSAV